MKINKTLKINDLCDILNGYAFKSDKYVSEGIRVIRITNVQKGFVEDTSPAFYPDSEEDKIKDYLLYENDLLVSLTGNVGRVALLEKQYLPAALNQRVACLRIKDQNLIHIKYLFTYLNSEKFENDCVFSAKGIAQKNMSTEWLKHYEIPVPEMNKQIEIYSNLEKVSEIINNHKALLSKYDILIKSRFIEMFGDNKYPRVAISEMVEGKVPSAKKIFNKSDKIKYIDISSVDNKINEIVGYTEYVFEDAPSRAQQHIHRNDILISTVRPNLKNIAINKLDYEETVASSGFCVLRPKYVPEYLFVSVLQDKFTSDMVAVTTGANYPAIKDSDILDYEICNPPLELQQQFADFVQQIDKSKFENAIMEVAA